METILVQALFVKVVVLVLIWVLVKKEWGTEEVLFSVVIPGVIGIIFLFLYHLQIYPIQVLYASAILGDLLFSFSPDSRCNANKWSAFLTLIILVVYLGNV
jgi:multisubunit Na+/H+ antiporter MnhE subunit